MRLKRIVLTAALSLFILAFDSMSASAVDSAPASTGSGASKGTPAALKAKAMAVRSGACVTDLSAHCSSVQKGGGRLLCCLKQSASSLSSECSAVLAKSKKYEGLDASTCSTTSTNPGFSGGAGATDEAAIQ